MLLQALNLVFGDPVRTSIGTSAGRRRIEYLWSCGCSASGASIPDLDLKPCREHRPNPLSDDVSGDQDPRPVS